MKYSAGNINNHVYSAITYGIQIEESLLVEIFDKYSKYNETKNTVRSFRRKEGARGFVRLSDDRFASFLFGLCEYLDIECSRRDSNFDLISHVCKFHGVFCLAGESVVDLSDNLFLKLRGSKFE